MKKIMSFVLICILVLSLTGCTKKEIYVNGNLITEVVLDKSRYQPSSDAKIDIRLYDETKTEDKQVVLDFYQLNTIVEHVTLTYDETVQYIWKTPENNNTGYLLKVSIMESDRLLDTKTVGIDVSSDWTFNPRYGFLTEYRNLSQSEINEILDGLNRYHINGLQFYDWQYKHHLPYDQDLDSWYDIANHLVEAEVIEQYINSAHERNMMAMNYNLIFGTYDDYKEDGILDEWGLYKDQSHQTLDYHPLPSTWATSKLYIMDPNNQYWREYISEQEEVVFSHFAFDGWHMDQLGDRGYTFTYGGSSVALQNSYGSYINYMKETLDTRILFNIVNNYGMLDILPNENIDFVYAEIWDNATYSELANTIKLYRNISNKPVVLAAYMNYDLSDNNGVFNTHSVLLTDATIFSYGGTHIELGDHGMLGNEYFPNDNLNMEEALVSLLKDYYDFQVAYQNLLIDQVDYVNSDFTIDNYEYSDNGSSNTIWGHSITTSNYEILHLINLLENDNDWRDNEGDKNAPIEVSDFKVKYYIEEDVKAVYCASPDYDGGLMNEVHYDLKTDKKRQYIELNVEHLKYWNMIIIEK